MEQTNDKGTLCQLIICRGIQGSGKSTWAKQWCLEDSEHRIRINNDDIRNMLGKYWVPSREKLVSSIVNNTILEAFKRGYDIVVDNMNLNSKTCEQLKSMVISHNHDGGEVYELEYRDFKTPVDECIRRDSLRDKPIGEQVIRSTYERYKNFYEGS